jgi:ABC-type microcin C transport system permease subunit YejB
MERAVKNPVWRALITEQFIQKVAEKYAYTAHASEAQIGDIFYQFVYQNHEKLGA